MGGRIFGKNCRRASRTCLFIRLRLVARLSNVSDTTTVAREILSRAKFHFILKNGPNAWRPRRPTYAAARPVRRCFLGNIANPITPPNVFGLFSGAVKVQSARRDGAF